MTRCATVFTQTDPMPMGAGSAFEGSYVYGGSRPSVMTDPSGERSVFTAGLVFPLANKAKRPTKTSRVYQFPVNLDNDFVGVVIAQGNKQTDWLANVNTKVLGSGVTPFGGPRVM
jgi:hypothetical protein